MSLYNFNDFRDNCGFGLIVYIYGEVSYELVIIVIYGLDCM